jgi:hypothetical protein
MLILIGSSLRGLQPVRLMHREQWSRLRPCVASHTATRRLVAPARSHPIPPEQRHYLIRISRV